MKFSLVILVLAVAAFSCVSASTSLVEADACTYGGQMGQCISDSSPCTGVRYSGLCTGASNIRCCMPSAQALFGDNGNGARITQTALQRLSETQHQEKWARWKNTHKPTFTSPAQEAAVYAVFRENRIQTVYLNDRYGDGKTVWSSITKFAAHRPDSFARQRLTFRNPTPSKSKGRSFLEMKNENENENKNSIPVDDSIQWKTFQKMAASLRANEKEAGITSFLENEISSTVDARGPYDDWLATHEEEHKKFEEKKNGPVSPDKPADVAAVAKLQVGNLIIDYRSLTGPIRDQGTCGSCWAHAATAVLEAAMIRAGIPMITLSPQWMVDCLADAPNQRCNGGFADFSYGKLQTMQIATEAEVPYKSAETTCSLPNGGNSGILVTDFGRASHCEPPLLPSGLDFDYVNACNSFTDANLLDILKKYGPVVLHVEANSWMNYRGGLLKGDSCKHGYKDINHAVVLVGYGQQEDGKFYWLIRNHWGDSWWGEEGYARVEAGGFACGATNFVTYVNVKQA